VFPARYELNFHILCRINLVFNKGLSALSTVMTSGNKKILRVC
jgi:hypothetical protein